MNDEYKRIKSMRLICVEKDTLAEIYACIVDDKYIRMRKTHRGIWREYSNCYGHGIAIYMKDYSTAFNLFIPIQLINSKTMFRLNEIQRIFNIPHDIIWYIKKLAVMSFINKK